MPVFELRYRLEYDDKGEPIIACHHINTLEIPYKGCWTCNYLYSKKIKDKNNDNISICYCKKNQIIVKVGDGESRIRTGCPDYKELNLYPNEE